MLLTLLLAIILAPGLTVAISTPESEALKAAINRGYTFKRTNWESALMREEHPMIKLEHITWSAKPRGMRFSVFTQLSLDRLPTLVNQCHSFSGPIAAAIYFPLVQTDEENAGVVGGGLSPANHATVAEAVRQVEEMQVINEANATTCALDVMLLYEVFNDTQAVLLYPINYLRNYARLQVRTRLMALIDVDLLISRTLSTEMVQPGRLEYYEAMCGERKNIVLPAMEPIVHMSDMVVGQRMAKNLANSDKATLRSMRFKYYAVNQFKMQNFPRGHMPTNYSKWFETSSLAKPYEAVYRAGYEPWYVTCWETMPWYDVRFRGYGGNKLIATASMVYYNSTFWVHPGAWLVHNPHENTKARNKLVEDARLLAMQGQLPRHALHVRVSRLIRKSAKAMRAGTYFPHVDPRFLEVFEALDWLQRPPQLVGSPRQVLTGFFERGGGNDSDSRRRLLQRDQQQQQQR